MKGSSLQPSESLNIRVHFCLFLKLREGYVGEGIQNLLLKHLSGTWKIRESDYLNVT